MSAGRNTQDIVMMDAFERDIEIGFDRPFAMIREAVTVAQLHEIPDEVRWLFLAIPPEKHFCVEEYIHIAPFSRSISASTCLRASKTQGNHFFTARVSFSIVTT
jgi:hypothetical protein